jgi:hypothetical protein
MLGSVALFGPLVVALWVFSVGDVVATPRAQVRRLSKRRWLLLTTLLPFVGSVAWIVAGRPATSSGRGYRRDRLATVITDADIREFLTAISPEDPEAFHHRCLERAHEQRRRYAAQQRAARPSQGTNGLAGAAD